MLKIDLGGYDVQAHITFRQNGDHLADRIRRILPLTSSVPTPVLGFLRLLSTHLSWAT
jgi:hypothetical protein